MTKDLSGHALKAWENSSMFFGGRERRIRKWKRFLGHCCEDVDVTLLAKQILHFLPIPIPPPSSISFTFSKHEWHGWVKQTNIVCGWEGRGIFVRFAYFSYYLIEAEKTSVITQWPVLRTSLLRQKIINPNKAFTNLLALRLDDVRDCPILLDLILTLSPSAAKCERGSLKK